MGLFTKEKKYNWKEGKFETTKKGVKLPFKGPEEGTLEAEVKKFEKQQREKKRKKRKKQYKSIANKINKTLDMIEGKPTKKRKTTKRRKPQKQRYVVKGGKAYPVYRPRTKTGSKRVSAKPRKTYDPFGGLDYDLFGSPKKKSKKKKKKKDPFDLKINW